MKANFTLPYDQWEDSDEVIKTQLNYFKEHPELEEGYVQWEDDPHNENLKGKCSKLKGMDEEKYG